MKSNDQRSGRASALLFCDLDAFKTINDRDGHAVGDTVLQTTAERVRRCLRRDDLAARLGGDELLVMVFGIQDLANAETMAETIRIAAAESIATMAGPVAISLSIGVVLIDPRQPIDSLIQQADQAMDEAKRLGRNRVVPIQLLSPVQERPT
ncbi:GGDEF domain-containing protein [Synechococcus sp. CBW1107]|uniref:GGDEF domain-containing protein n=1 Tax=Synechococcus sp. CBW1107 TaxID=2789857 RepID=UPI002AD46400|nr:GGDEF domain-containing protein [Synechococcus sp. CBW1107]CAK6692716.1 Diguanylate cyclase DgcM [Synechococcus sp. CBW1107]